MSEGPSKPEPRWQPLNALERRVLGVLIEKAKTTPDGYPLSLNALRTGCNQKSNRDPQMDVADVDVDDALERLRALGAASEIQGDGRVAKYRHYAYDWLGVEKLEAAVMAELLLRGPQTVGELRGRASRMDRIADLAALRPILQALIDRKLVISLTPEGRGQIVTHGLYQPHELEQVKRQYAGSAQSASPPPAAAPPAARPAPTAPHAAPQAPAPSEDLSALRRELAEARAQIADLRDAFDEIAERCTRNETELEQLKTSLGV